MKKVLFVWPNKDSFGVKPIGLSILSAIARRLGWNVKLFDTSEIDFGYVENTKAGEEAKLYKYVDLLQYGHKKRKIDLNLKFTEVLNDFNPSLLAFSVLSDEAIIAAQISAIAKKDHPEIPIIWGGIYPTLNPQTILEKGYADFVCVGEGLDAFSDFLKGFSGDNSLYNIPNIWAKKNNLIIKNNIRPLRNNLDDLPYLDWEIFDKPHFYRPFDGKVYVNGEHMLNWGCLYHCSYCINNFLRQMYNNKYFIRRYSVKRIIKELKCLKEKYNLNFFNFQDEDFLFCSVDTLREFSGAYKREIGLPFIAATNPKSVTEEKAKLLKEMDCRSITVGIENGDINIRKNILKRVDSSEDVVRVFFILEKAGIRVSAYNLLGIPFESRKSYEATIELNRKANVQYPFIGFFYPFEGTELREIAIKEGFFNSESDGHARYFRNKPALHFNNLTETELIQMRNVFVLYIKLPKCYEIYIKRSEIQDSIGIALRKKLLKIYEKTVWFNNGTYVDDGLKEFYIKELENIISHKNSQVKTTA